jgi:hypothetical protein
MNTLKFEYPDYPNISKEVVACVKRNRNVSVMKREAIRFVEKRNKKLTKKPKVDKTDEGESSHLEAKIRSKNRK